MPTPCCARGAAVAGHRDQAVDEIGRRVRHRQRVPAQLVRRRPGRRRSGCGSAAARSGANGRASPPAGCGTASCAGSRARGAVNAVPRSCSAYSPCATCCGELRPCRQRARQRLGGELVAEAGLVAGAACDRVVGGRAPDRRTVRWTSRLAVTARRAHLVALDALEQRLEVALAEALVALALDDLEEDRADRVLGEDLQQLALLASPGRRRSGSCSSSGARTSSPWFGTRSSITSK